MDNLALSYRPRRFADLIGQHAAQIVLRQMVKINRVPHALMFDGSRGTGKTTTARILAAALNCDADDRPCGSCVSCKATFDGSSMDVIEIDAASNGLVDDIRALRQQVLYRGTGEHRVIILDEAHSMSHAAFNALLKTLEEPPPRTVFILLTTEPHKIPDTVVSRCMPFTFRRLTVADITARLKVIAAAENYPCDEQLLVLLAERGDGAMRDAIMLFDQVARVGMTTAEQYQRLIGHVDTAASILRPALRHDLAAALTALEVALTRVADPAVIATDLISLLRDVIVLRAGGELSATGVALADRQYFALAMETPTIVTVMRLLWELKTRTRLDDARALLEVAVVMLTEIISPAPAPAAAARVTLAQMVNPA